MQKIKTMRCYWRCKHYAHARENHMCIVGKTDITWDLDTCKYATPEPPIEFVYESTTYYYG